MIRNITIAAAIACSGGVFAQTPVSVKSTFYSDYGNLYFHSPVSGMWYLQYAPYNTNILWNYVFPPNGEVGQTSAGYTYISPSSEYTITQLYGAQCVALVKAFTNATGSTKSWRSNQAVTPSISPYSVIAKFTGTYDGWGRKYDGYTGGHTGIVIASNQSGVMMFDQNYQYDNAVAVHWISWSEAEKYHTIKLVP